MIDKSWFNHLGKYDTQMDIWGGENFGKFRMFQGNDTLMQNQFPVFITYQHSLFERSDLHVSVRLKTRSRKPHVIRIILLSALFKLSGGFSQSGLSFSYRHMHCYTDVSTVQVRKRNLLVLKLLLVFGEYSSSPLHDSRCCPSSEVESHSYALLYLFLVPR